jgi:aryl-alcohol dehydrogenase-like predicted oxidoreductase
MRLFDTADVYGHGLSERRLGQLAAKVPRAHLILSSKVGYFSPTTRHPYDPDTIRRQLARTLMHLGTNYLDIYAAHSGDFGPDDTYLPSAARELHRQRDHGVIRAISMRAPHEFAAEWACEPTTPDGHRALRFLTLFHRLRPDILVVRHNMLSRRYLTDETDIHSFAKGHGVGVVCKQVLAQGLLVGRHDPERPPTFGDGDHRSRKAWFSARGLRIIAEELRALHLHFGPTSSHLVRAALGFVLDQAPRAVALVGVSTARQIADISNAATLPLRADDLSLVRWVGQRIRAALEAEFGPDDD